MSRTVEQLTIPENQDADQVVSQLKALNLLRKEQAERKKIRFGRIRTAVLWVLGVFGFSMICPYVFDLELPSFVRIGCLLLILFVVANLQIIVQFQSELLNELVKLRQQLDQLENREPPEHSD